MTDDSPTINYEIALTAQEGREAASQLFSDTYGYEPGGVWQAPGRVNIIGEHVDYNGGLCLPIALPHRAYLAFSPRRDRHVRLVSPQTRDHIDEFDLDTIGPVGSAGEVKGWAAYLAGVPWALEQAGYGPLTGFDAALYSCVPLGAGLSSSAALECSVAVAINEENSLNLIQGSGGMQAGANNDGQGSAGNGPTDVDAISDEQGRLILVEACCRAERDVAGANTGGLDQSASLRCQQGHALELDCADMSAAQIPFDLAATGLALLVIDTRAPHQLVDGQYAQRRQTCEDAAHLLGVNLLADVTDTDQALTQITDPTMRKRVRHVFTEIARTREFIDVLRSGPLTGERLERIGTLMNSSHDSLRDDYEVTCPELDLVVDTARKNGAHGARMTGGGFGGSAIALVDSDQTDAVAQSIAHAFAEQGFTDPAFLIATPEGPAGRA